MKPPPALSYLLKKTDMTIFVAALAKVYNPSVPNLSMRLMTYQQRTRKEIRNKYIYFIYILYIFIFASNLKGVSDLNIFVWKWSKIAAQKKYFFLILLTKHGGNHASRWIRDLWSKGISLILAYL